MQAIMAALVEQHAELDGLIDTFTDDDWHRPTRCEGWTVADVVLHLAQTDELALASAQGDFADVVARQGVALDARRTVDDRVATMVADERGLSNEALTRRWRDGAAELRNAFAASDPHRRVGWVAGQLSARTLATTRLAECWIHTGDVAEAVGAEQRSTDRLEHVARLAWRTLPYAFARAGRQLSGPVAFELEAPSGRRWNFVPDTVPTTVIEGPGDQLCLVAARRITSDETSLRSSGPDSAGVLELVRTYA